MKNLSKVTLLAVVVAMSSVIATPAAVADTKPAADVEKFSSDKLHEERAYTLGTSAFIWGFPMTELGLDIEVNHVNDKKHQDNDRCMDHEF